jgi:heme exporter protein CcmD
MSEFLNMSGYAAHVWSSYAIALGGLIVNVILARRTLRQARAEARRRLAMEKLT